MAPKQIKLPTGVVIDLSLDNPLFKDFERMPATFEEFISDPYYLGSSWKNPFPAWKEAGKEVFPLPLRSPYNSVILLGATGIGKAALNGTGVLTPTGYVPIERLQVGDLVASNDGKFYPVTGVFPQGKKPIYEIEFGYDIRCKVSDEHIWTVSRDYGRTYHDETTKDIVQKGWKYINKNTGWSQHQVELPPVQPVQMAEADLPIDPYLLGCLIGDGCLSKGELSYSSNDQFIIDRLNEVLLRDWRMCLKKFNGAQYSDWDICFADKTAGLSLVQKHKTRAPLRNAIAKLGLDTTADKKHIPKEYIFSSISQRKALLNGLIDTDGTVNSNGVVEFTTVSERLAKDVKLLCETLGYIVKYKFVENNYYTTQDKQKIQARPIYFLTIYTQDILGELPRKVEKQSSRHRLRKVHRVHNITYVGEGECTCISIDAPSHLYIIDGCIPTHNTSFAVNMVIAYYLHVVLCLKNPHEYFALEEQKKIVFAFLNIVTKTIAYQNAWGMIHRALLKSPFFMEYGISTNGIRPEWVCTKKPVELIYGSTADNIIGLDVLCAFLDEVSFARNSDIQRQMEKAKEVFDAALERIQSRFTKFGGVFDGLIIMASSKRTDQAFAEVYAKQLLEGKNGGKVFVVDKPRWEILPKGTYCGKTFPVAVGDKTRPSEIIREDQIETFKKAGYRIIYPPIETYDEFSRDMLHALTNIAGESVSAGGRFLPGEHVGACIDKTLVNPFRQGTIYVGSKDPEMYQDFFDLSRVKPEDFARPLYIHLDASLGTDGNSISGGFIDYAQNQLDQRTGSMVAELHYRQFFKIKVRAPKGDQTQLRKNTQFILWLRQQGFNIKHVTSDNYQSIQFRQDLASAGITCTYQSIDAVQHGVNQPYSVLRNTICEHRIKLLDDDDQTEELLNLIKYEDGRVDKPGNGISDDAAQVLCGWVYSASADKDNFVQTNVVLDASMEGSTGYQERQQQQDLLPTELIVPHEELVNEFGAYKVSRRSNIREAYDRAFGSTPREPQLQPNSSPFNFF